ncbi:hypothetical protein VP01_3850g1 [Puccinia sorghi]|uniref:Uncharacterized protein n=1 Tax=Puccinia sorghi TaxID=27349 RepID=A0A0L6UT29_9BASI|nr:hypothetical protein VP01_3850g1 [Puccinia sorghi]
MSLQILVTLAAIVALVVAQDLTVNTPTSVQECLPVALSWTGGVPPVYVSLIPGGQPGGAMIKDFGAQNGNLLTWNVDQPAGTSLTVQIRDSTGKLNYSDKFTVQESKSCGAGGKPATTPGGSTASNPPAVTSHPSTAAGGNATKGSSSPAGGSSPTPSGSGSAPAGSPAPSNVNTAATNGSSPSAQAGSDASRTIPAFAVVALAGVVAIFA